MVIADKYNISYSKISKFKHCPWSFLHYINRAEAIKTAWMETVIGSAIHKTLEDAVKVYIETKNYKECFSYIAEHFENNYKTQKEDYKAKGFELLKSKFFSEKKSLKNGFDMTKLGFDFMIKTFLEGFAIETEKEFSIDFDDEVQLNGIIDLFLYNDNDIKLFDYKSTKNPVRFYFVEWDDDIQKLMYEFYIYKTYSKMPHSFNYVVLNYDNRTVFLKNYNTVIKEDFNGEQYFRNLSHIINEIKNFITTRSTDFEPEASKCKWCEYRQICEHRYVDPLIQKIKLRV